MGVHKEGWVHKLKWVSPYTEPPKGLPRVLGVWTDRNPTMEDYKKVYPEYELGCGFCSTIEFPYEERKRLPKETRERMKARRNKTKKANWLKKNMPLFAEQIIEEEKLDWRKELKK